MKSFLYLIFLVGIIGVSNLSRAHDFSIGIGNLSEYIKKYQTDDKGALNLFNFNPGVKAHYEYQFSETFSLMPDLLIMLPKNNGDSNTTHWSFYTSTNALYRINHFNFFSGLGLYFTRISSKGGTEVLNNGDSTTAFYLPESAVLARNLIVTLGGFYQFDKEWSLEMNSLIFNLLTKENRSFSIGLYLNYHLGEVFK